MMMTLATPKIMQRLTFSFTEQPGQKYVGLSPSPAEAITEATWERLARHVAEEPGLSNYPAELLAGRWQAGRAAIGLQDNQIVSYISLIPILGEAARRKLSEAIAGPLPSVEMYESATGYTHPDWRHRGKSS